LTRNGLACDVPGFASSGTFVLWNVLGVLDLIVAVGTGAASSAL
jgi:hypothetical protein